MSFIILHSLTKHLCSPYKRNVCLQKQWNSFSSCIFPSQKFCARIQEHLNIIFPSIYFDLYFVPLLCSFRGSILITLFKRQTVQQLKPPNTPHFAFLIKHTPDHHAAHNTKYHSFSFTKDAKYSGSSRNVSRNHCHISWLHFRTKYFSFSVGMLQALKDHYFLNPVSSELYNQYSTIYTSFWFVFHSK